MQYLLMGILLGLTAGISPGPLLTLVVTETLKYGKKSGVRIALSPLVTDVPIILLTLYIFSGLTYLHSILGFISIAGGIFIAYLGVGTLRTKGMNVDENRIATDSFKKGIVANFLSPHPYLFWSLVGAPIFISAWEAEPIAALLFLLVFYTMLTGSKVLIAWLTEKSRSFLNGKLYIGIMRILGVVLLVFALFFFFDGLKMLSGQVLHK